MLFHSRSLAANESLSPQNNRSFRFDAHDWHESVGVAERIDPGNET